MADSSTQSLTMNADAAAIMDVIADFAAYPEWTGAVKKVEVTDPGPGARAKRVKFGLDAGLIKDTYELEYTWSPDGLGVTWDLVIGLAVQLNVPLIGPLRRKAERTIMDTALKELRKRVEGAK